MPETHNHVTASIGSAEVEQILELTFDLLTKYRVDRIPNPDFDTSNLTWNEYIKERRAIRTLNDTAKPVNCMYAIRARLTEEGIYSRKRKPEISINKVRHFFEIIDDHAATNCIKNEHYPEFREQLTNAFSKYIKI